MLWSDFFENKVANLAFMFYVDSDYVRDTTFSRSRSGWIALFCALTVTLISKMQTTIAQSTTDVDYFALNDFCQNISWLRRFLSDIWNRRSIFS